jgi:hypothetical protein
VAATKRPPPTRTTGSEMPKSVSTYVPISIEVTITNQPLIATWRASRLAMLRLAPTVAMNTGAVLSGLMIGSKVTGTRISAFRKGTTIDSTRPPQVHRKYGARVYPELLDTRYPAALETSRGPWSRPSLPASIRRRSPLSRLRCHTSLRRC